MVMIASSALSNSGAIKVASDATKLADPVGIQICLAKQPFAPSATLVIGDLVEADFAGYLPIQGPGGNQFWGYAADNASLLINIGQWPTGPAIWRTASAAALPQTIYGFWISDIVTGLVVYASGLLDDPEILSRAGQFVSLDALFLRYKPLF